MEDSMVISMHSEDENVSNIGREFHAFRPISSAVELSPTKPSKYSLIIYCKSFNVFCKKRNKNSCSTASFWYLIALLKTKRVRLFLTPCVLKKNILVWLPNWTQLFD